MATNPYDLSTNPYLQTAADSLTKQVTNNLNTNILPGIDSGAVAAGGYGGSRQGVADGLAVGQTNLGLGSALSNMYSNALGQNLNFYTQQRGLDQSGATIGANLINQGNQGFLSQGTGITGIGNTQQQAPWQVTNNAANVFSPFSGLGGSQIQTQQGSQLGGALGGALLGSQLGKSLGNLGLGTSGSGWASPIGFGSGFGYGNQDLGQYF